MSNEWFATSGEKRLGPFSTDQLRALLVEGKVQPGDLIWCQGMRRAMPAEQVPQLAGAAEAGHRHRAPVTVEQVPTPPPDSPCTPQIVAILEDTRRVARMDGMLLLLASVLAPVAILGVAGALAVATMILFGLATWREPSGEAMQAWMEGAAVCAVTALVSSVPAAQLLHYARHLRPVIVSGSQADLREALKAERTFWRSFCLLALCWAVGWLVLLVRW
jgi:hypothetical protein